MQLLWMKYKNKIIMVICLGKENGKLTCLKVYDGGILLSDNMITTIRANSSKWNKMELKDLIYTLKNIIPNFNKICKTYIESKCMIIKSYPIIP